jgi:dihydrodipicolinate reductase
VQKVKDIEPEAASDVVLTSSLESGVDVVIDFSSPQGTLALAKRAEELGIALVIGTTAKVHEFTVFVSQEQMKLTQLMTIRPLHD